jgi:AmiR/NasT family two-component response regulator
MNKISTEGLEIELANTEKKKIFRPTELSLPRKVYLTEDAYTTLRRQKKKQQKSMAKIVCDLIKATYLKK